MVLILSQCCCGCSLKTGTIIIAVLQALGGFSVMVSMSLNAYKPGNVTVFSGRNHGLTDEEVGKINNKIRGILADPKEICIGLAVLGCIQFILSIMLVYGANDENPKLVRPWVIFSLIMTIIMISTYFAFALLTFFLELEGAGAAILIGMVPAAAIMLYFILVVYSFYRKLLTCSGPCNL